MKRAINSQLTRIALIQMRCGVEPEKNFARAIGFIRDAARQGARIVCLPELFRSQYFCQTEDHKNFDLAEEVPGTSTAALGELAREIGTVIIASLFERRSAGVYHNTAAIIDTDGELLGKYRKMHVPDDPLYHEKFYFASVDQEEIVTADIDWSRVNEHRTHWPFLRDRRVDAYGGLDRRLID